jgi:NADH-quinone oxidoreductase subunit N
MLVARMFSGWRRSSGAGPLRAALGMIGRLHSSWFALAGSVLALGVAAPWLHLGEGGAMEREIFTGLLKFDGLTVYFRAVLLLFAVLFFIFTRLSGIPDQEDSPDFCTLVLGATLGMALMASSNHLLMVFLSVEMASVPSYVLAGLLKGRRASSEAALKYSVYGAGAAGVMLYGISLLSGALGTAHLPTMAQQIAVLAQSGALADRQTVLMMGGLFVMVGLAFKLSAVPFHFWCPDVFEGACAEVNAFLSVSSKAAALALLVRVAAGVSQIPDLPPSPEAAAPPAEAAPIEPPRVAELTGTPQALESEDAVAPPAAAESTNDEVGAARDGVRRFIVGLVGLIAAITATFGNLAAYAQTNIKRLLAYSTIAHAGIMIMPVAAAVELAPRDPELADQAIAGIAFYVGTYLFMNLGAFAIVAFLRNALRSEEIGAYAGLIRRSPLVALCFSIILLSLLGLPPLAGWVAKFSVFAALTSAELYLLFAIAGLNTVLSLFYYLRVVKVMTLDPEPADRLPVEISGLAPPWIYVAAVTVPVVVLGMWVDPLNRWARAAAAGLFS